MYLLHLQNLIPSRRVSVGEFSQYIHPTSYETRELRAALEQCIKSPSDLLLD